MNTSNTIPTIQFTPFDRTGTAVPVDCVPVDLDRLITSRLLVQANSGAGKSRALRALLESTHGHVQQIVFDPEGEFSSLREHFNYVLAGVDGDVPATPESARVLCRRLMELGASAVLDLYDLSPTERRRYVRLFLEELMALPRELWRPLLVVIDEAHNFCPERGAGESESTDAVKALCSQGRKRGYCAVLASQRLSKVHKDAAAELLNKLIGRTSMDVDIRRAADDLGFNKEQGSALKKLQPGQFYAYGPAISDEVQLVCTPEVLTTHPEAGRIGYTPPPAPEAIRALVEQLQDLPQRAEQEARTMESLQNQLESARGEVKRWKNEAEKNKAGVLKVVDHDAIQRAVEKAVANVHEEYRRKIGSALADVRQAEKELCALLQNQTEATSAVTDFYAAQVKEEMLKPKASTKQNYTGGFERDTPQPVKEQLPSTRVTSTKTQVTATDISTPQQNILNALATFEALGVRQPQRHNIAVWANQSPKSSGYRNNLSTLNSKAYIFYPTGQTAALTDKGRAASRAQAIRSLDELHEAWMGRFSGPQRAMLRVLINTYPDAMKRSDLAYHTNQSPKSSGFRNNMSNLCSFGVARYPDGNSIAATQLLFPDVLK